MTNQNPGRLRAQRTRPTIGLLIGNTWHPIAWDVWAGANDVSQEHNANLLCFAGEDLNPPLDYFSQANVLYDLVSTENVDGLVIWGGGLGQYVSPQHIQAFCDQYRPIPMVNAALPLDKIPTVLVDNYQGMRQVMLHLIQVHQYRKIAFVSGPQGHPEAEDRYRAYVEALAEHQIPVDEQLFAPGDFNPDSGGEAVKLFLDDRKLRPGQDIEAIVAADDGMAISAMGALQSRGIRVPEDIAITGFDNAEEGWYTKPTLTTVPVLVYEQARQATELVLELIKGGTVPDQILIPTRVVLRESCGCLNPNLLQPSAGALVVPDATFEAVVAARRRHILSDMRKAVESSSLGMVPQEMEQLLDSFLTELRGEANGTFITTLEEILRKGSMTGGSVAAWQGALSELRNHLIPHLDNAQLVALAESLLQQARVVIGEAGERIQVNWRVQVEQRTGMVNVVGQELLSTFDLPQLTDMAAGGFNYLGIRAAYLTLYENPDAPTEWSRLIMGYDQQGRMQLEPAGQRFASKQILPAGLFPSHQRYSMVVEPLYFRDEQLGFVVFDANPRDALFYDALRGHLSSAIKGALVVDQHRWAETRLSAIHTLGQELVLTRNVDQIAKSVVNAAEQVLRYPGFSLWLLDEQEHQLTHWTQDPELDHAEMPVINLNQEQSIVAAVIRSGSTIYLPDTSKDPRYLVGPSTALSELCIPLKVGQQVIGALNTENPNLNAFKTADIQVLEALANTAAIAIHNARLHHQALQRAERLTAANRTAQAAIKELEAFAYSVSHDLRAPLRSINGFSQALEEDYFDALDQEGKKMLQRVRSASQRMGQLIDGMLQLSRLTRGDLTHSWIDLSELVAEIVAELQKEEPDRLLELHITPDLVTRGDARLIQVMLENLVSNAWKFTQHKELTKIEFGRCEVDGEAVFCLRDNGAGFDMAYVDKLFKTFQRLHTVTEFDGSGIGLATVQRIVHRHGGRVWAEGQLDEGATFFFTLPSDQSA